MTTDDPDDAERPTTPARAPDAGTQAWAWASDDLAALDDLVARVRRRTGDLDPDVLELELETAREELRVADEELRVQREQLDDLLTRHRTTSEQRRRVAAMLPVPMLSTDESGRIEHANAAAAALLHVPLVRLLGKPVVTFVGEADRGAVRTALADAGAEPVRLRVTLAPRRSEPLPVDVVLAAQPREGAGPELEWTVLNPAAAHEDAGPSVDPLRLAAAVAAMSRLPVRETDVRSLLATFARTAVSTLDDSVAVSVGLGRPDAPTEIATTSHDAAVADGLQLRVSEGPGVDAYDEGETVVTDDVRVDPRWPELTRTSGDSPVASAVAVPVVANGTRVGVLHVYSREPGAFAEPQVHAAEVMALAAGAALEAVEETRRLRELAGQLDRALESRAVIDQAKGIVMARRGCTAEEAFTHLAALSQQRNVKLRDLARELVEQTAAAAGAVSRRRS